MRYFVESVTTYSTTGKTRKGAIIQKVAKEFEHVIIGDNTCSLALISALKRLADACNKVYKGREVIVEYNRNVYQICIGFKRNAETTEGVICSIQLAPINMTMYSSNVHQSVNESMRAEGDKAVLEAYYERKGGEA